MPKLFSKSGISYREFVQFRVQIRETQDNKYGKRVNANLISVLKRQDDEPFGEGRVDTSDAWDDDEDWEDDDAGDDDDDV